MSIDEYFLLPPRREGFSLKKKWLTEILFAIDGHEQRTALFTWPRRSIKMSPVAVTSPDLNYLKRILFKKTHLTWGIPFFQDRTHLTSQASSGQKILNVESTLHRHFEVGAPCVIFRSRSSYEAGVIESFSGAQITLNANLANAWPAGTRVCPVLRAKLQVEQEINLLAQNYGDMPLTATEDYSDITRAAPDISMFPTYKSLPVFNFRPETGTLKNILHRPFDYLSYLGKSYSMTHWNETAHRIKGAYQTKGREKNWNILNFFDAQRGRWGSFWISTYHADIVVTTPFNSGDTVINIDPIDYGPYWGGSQTVRHIAALWPDETLICREIIGHGDATVTLNSSFGKSCDDPGTLLVSFLLLARFDIDEIEARMVSDDEEGHQLFSIDLTFQSLPLETPA